MKDKKIQILMSTYNGEKYISRQLNSIVKQDVPVSLLIRDDGSSDATVDIIEKYEKKYDFISHKACDNTGVIHSFFELFRMADKDADYYALADQDDIWFNDKISRAVEVLDRYPDDVPVLYCAAQKLIDAEDNVLKVRMRDVSIRPGFGNAVVENIATGCTCVFNKKMLELVSDYEPEYTIMHDWWLYMAASCFGKVIYDRKPYMKYRQHEENTVGSAVSSRQLIKKRIENFQSLQQYVPEQIAEFSELFELPEDKKKLADLMLIEKGRYLKRMKIFCCWEIRRRRLADTVFYKILYLFWK